MLLRCEPGGYQPVAFLRSGPGREIISNHNVVPNDDEGNTASEGARPQVTADAAEVVSLPMRPTHTLPTRLGRSSMWFVGIAAVQAVWLGVLMSRGWFYQDDITFLEQATGRSLSVAYLTDPVNDHLTPGLRLAFWLLRPLGLEHHWVTIALRIVLQGAATLLLGRLLVLLVGDRLLVRWVVAGYAFSPLLLAPLWLSCAMNVLPAQVFVLLGITAHVRYTRTGRLWSAAWVGIAFVLAAMFWELSSVDLLLLPLLSIGFLHSGSPGQRLRATLARSQGWLLTLGPTFAFAVAYAIGGYGGSARSVSVGTVVSAWGREWAQTVAPMSVGGPWRWSTLSNVYFSPTSTPIVAIIVVQAVFAAAILLSVRRTGWSALIAWAMPLVSVVLTATIVVIGRYHGFGFLSFRQISYAFDAAVPLSLAVCLAFAKPGPDRSATARTLAGTHRHASRVEVALAAAGAAVLLGGTIVSAVRFTNRWHENPTEPYVAALRSDLASRPDVNLFDTALPTSVLPYFQPNRHLSDLLPVVDVSRATANNGPDPLIGNEDGRIVDAMFIPAAKAVLPTQSFCGDLYHGPTVRTHKLSTRPGGNEWFVKLDYFQQHPTVVYLTMIDDHGHQLPPVTGSRVVLESDLASHYLRFRHTSPIAIRIRTAANDANVCVTGITVGSPLPKPAQ